MLMAELVAYAKDKYQIEEQHKWADFPGFSVLSHPKTGKWVALLMRQWDTESGTEIERCDLKCGSGTLVRFSRPYITSPIRMRGYKWVDIAFDDRTEPVVVFQLFDQAMAEENGSGCTIVLGSELSAGSGSWQDTPLPFSGSSYRSKKEQLPEKLREMRRLFVYGRESAEAIAENFYRQAVFMQDYEDDCPWTAGGFFRYFPTYHDMTTQQLRGYFTWRSHVRRGDYQPITASAAYIYIYELLNGVGADSPEDVLKKMQAFEDGYIAHGMGDKRMQTNLRRWMLEYAVLNDLPPELARGYADQEMMARDAALAVLMKPEAYSDDEVFQALCRYSGKKAAESPVIRLDPAHGQHLFGEVWRSAAASGRQEKKLFVLCFGEMKTRRWYPLGNAIYYKKERPANRVYVLNECRSFCCKDGLWTESAFESLSFSKAVFQGFMHETDARLRRYLKTGRYLKEKPEDAWVIPFIDAAIEADKKALAEAARPKITIDLSGLDKIRRDAAGTRDSLLTEEELYEPEDVMAPEKTVMMPEETATAPEETYMMPEATVADPGKEEISDLPLDKIQIQILRALLRGEDVTEMIKNDHLMPAITADLINEALFDEFGDTVVDCEDDHLTLVEDYSEDLARLLGEANNG